MHGVVMATQEKRIAVYRILQLWCSEKPVLPLKRRREFESLFLESEYNNNTPSAVADVTGKEDVSEVVVETETERCYGSKCECWVVSLTSGGRERRNAADPLGTPGEERLQIFVLQDRNTPEVELLRTSRNTTPQLSWIVQHKRPWHAYLVSPEGCDDVSRIPLPTSPMTRIPPPATSTIPLFSLTRLIYNSPEYDKSGGVLEQGVYEDVGLFYSLPLHPPPSQLIPSCKYPVPDGGIDVESLIGFCGCNGLYCLQVGPLCGMVAVFVWNPTTGLSRQLPPFKHDGCGLYFGFGYDQSSEDYKVVKIDERNQLVELFSLYNSTSWRSLQGFPGCAFLERSYSDWGVSVAGCLNWPVSVNDELMVASFDLATERFQMLPLPPTYDTLSHGPWRSSLWILDGYLSFVALHDLSGDYSLIYSRCASRVLDIWIMREYGVESSWTNAATIAFPHSITSPFRILCLSKDVLILHVLNMKVLVFNLKQNSLVSPHIHGFSDFSGNIELFVQTEVSPYGRINLTVPDKTMKITLDYDFSILSSIEKESDGNEDEEFLWE